MSVKNKKGSLELSFGTLFSIFLIIFFVAIAFYVINSFLKSQKCAQVGLFIDDLETDVNKAWNSQKSDFEFKGRLPTNLKYICFGNLSKSMSSDEMGREISIYKGSNANLFFYPRKNSCGIERKEIKHLDVESIISSKNPYCIQINDGLVKFQIEKGFNDALIKIK